MKLYYIGMIFSLFVASSAVAERITVRVNGMVCAFCAQGIKKSFSKLAEVKEVIPDLESKVVTLVTAQDKTLSDEAIREIIVDAGYAVTSIERAQQ